MSTSSDSVVCGGVKLQGLHTATSVRQVSSAVVTEEARFFPYLEAKPAAMTSSPVQMKGASVKIEFDLEKYAADCSRIASKIIQKMANSESVAENKIPNKELLAECSRKIAGNESGTVNVDKYLTNDHCGIMQCLDKIDSLPESQNYAENLKNVLEALEEDSKKDILITNLIGGNYLKYCLDIVNENCKEKNLRLLTLSRQQFSDVTDRLTLTFEGDPTLNSMISRSEDDDGSLLTKLMTDQPLVADNAELYHMIIVDGVLSECKTLTSALFKLASAVTTYGFVLIKEPTHNLNVAHLLQRLFKDCTNQSDSANRDFGSFLNKGSWEKLFLQSLNFVLVSSCTDDVMSSMFLLRKLPTETPVDLQTVVHIDSKNNFDWLPALQEKLALCQKTQKGDKLWLVANGEPASGIVGMVKCLVKEPGGSCVR